MKLNLKKDVIHLSLKIKHRANNFKKIQWYLNRTKNENLIPNSIV